MNKADLVCPQCGQILGAEAQSCPQCGVDLALVALLAERAYLEGIPHAAPLPATADILVPRIGEFLLERQLISPQQLAKALAHQKENASNGKRQLLGETLVELAFISRETLDTAINQQILALHAALQEANRGLEQRVADRTAELRQALARLAEVNQLKANLISNVSHELRTPLAHIKGYVELMAELQLGAINEEQASALVVVQRSIGRLEQLINNLIEFATASREGLQISKIPVRLEPLCADAIGRLAETAAKVQVTVRSQLPPDLPELMADPQRLNWVLYQLLENGIKFSKAGGEVVIGARCENNLVTIAIRDHGIGIPSSRLDELFEPLHQLDGSSTRRYGGTGLGLALVKLILDAHGSEIKVRSEEGVGSTFWFSLAVEADKQ